LPLFDGEILYGILQLKRIIYRLHIDGIEYLKLCGAFQFFIRKVYNFGSEIQGVALPEKTGSVGHHHQLFAGSKFLFQCTGF
jgi:hypothetical protein